MAELSLADLIDLELELQRDRGRPIEALHERDARIAREIGDAAPDGRALALAWLEQLRPAGGASTGRRVQVFLERLGLALFACGVFSGAGTVAGWLELGGGRPVNTIHFWSVLVGAQLLLLAAFAVAARRDVLGALGAFLPAFGAAVLARLDPARGASLRATLGELRKLDWLYARLRFWRTTALSQGFAVAFNLGALAALVVIPYLDDPAFGWRSRLLDSRQLHAAASAIAWPWTRIVAAGVPTLEEVERTRTSSVDPRFDPARHASAAEPVWAAWWPFLVASLLAYGLLPRLLLWSLAQQRVRSELAAVSLDHADFQRLRERLARPAVETRAGGAECAPESAVAPLPRLDRSAPFGPAGAELLRWEGVQLDEPQIRELLAREFQSQVARVHAVGGLEPERDRLALEALRAAAPQAPVVLLVQAWEPPVADYVDFLARARGSLGEGRLLVVLLHETDAAGHPAPATPRELRIWRQRLARLGDPWLRVEPLVAGALP